MDTQNVNPGYKGSSGFTPTDWEIKKLGDVIILTSGQDLTTKEYNSLGNGIPYITGASNIENGSIIVNRWTEMPKTIAKDGDLLITVKGTVGTMAILNEPKVHIARQIMAIKNKDSTTIPYIKLFLEAYIQKLKDSVNGLIPGITRSTILNIEIPLPSLSEQEMIVKILGNADEMIDKTQKMVENLESRNRWLMQKLLSGKIRLKGFDGPIRYSELGTYIKEISEKNKDNTVKTVLSVTNSRGFVNQDDQFGREIASKDKENYKIIKKGQFAYNPSRVNVGSIDLLRNFEIGILSPMYVVFETDGEKLLSDFLYYHLKSHRFYGNIPMFVQGSVRDSLGFDGLSKMTFFIPSVEEQKAIVTILDKSTEQLDLYKQKLEKLQTMKKGLLQQLLTGKVRVKEFRN